MKKGHNYNINDPRYVKTLGPVVSIATDNALAPAEQVVDDDFLYNTTAQYLGTELTDDDKSQWLINRILRDHLRNVENGNFSGDVTIEGDLTVNGDYVNLPIATTTKYGITRLASGTTDPDNNDVVTVSMLNAVKDLLMGPDNTPALDTILELAEAIGDPEQAQSILGRLTHLEECCDEVQELLKKKYTVTYNLFGNPIDYSVTPFSSNTKTEDISYGESYFTTILPDTNELVKGNPFLSYSVMMGDDDITRDVVTEGDLILYIDIESVTDDVVIRVVGNGIHTITKSVSPSSAGYFTPEGVEYLYTGTDYVTTFTELGRLPDTIPNCIISYSGGSHFRRTQSGFELYGTIELGEDVDWTILFSPGYGTTHNIIKNIDERQITIISETGNNGDDTINDMGIYGINVLPKAGYRIISMSGTVNGNTYHPAEGVYQLNFAGVHSDVVITVESEKILSTYNITKSATNATINGGDTVQEGNNYTATITANSGYTVSKSNITVKNSSNENVPFSYKNGTLKILSSDISSDITITVVALHQAPTTYTITRNYTSGQVTLTLSTASDTITAGYPYSVSAAPAAGFQIDSMTVTQGGNSVAVSNHSATINSVSGNIVVTVTSSAVQEPIPEALLGVSKITIKENKNKLYSGELDIRTSTVNGARQNILPRQYEGSSRGYGVTNGDGTYYFKNGEYHIGGHLYEDEMCVIYIYMSQNNSGNIYDAMDWVFGQIDSYNNLLVTNDTKVCYSSTNATNDARIMVYPIKYNPGAPRTIEVPLGVPAGITVDNNHTGGGSTIYVNQDKSRAIYEIVDANDNVIPFEFGNGTFAQQAGIGNASTTTGITDEEFEAAFGWNCFGQFGINTAGTYTFKLRVFGIASRPLYSHELYIPTAYNNDKDMYRYILGDVDITTADPVTGDAVVTPFRCSITSERSNTSIAYTPYASIIGTGTNNEFVQTSVVDQGGDTIYIWDLDNRIYGYSLSGTFTEGNCVEIPFILTITEPVGNSGGLAIFCRLIDGQGRTLTSVYSPIMRLDVYSAYALVWNYDKTQIARRLLSEINDWMVEKGSEFNAEFYPQSGYSITDVTLAYNGNTPLTVATLTITINPVEGPIEITITSAAA